MFGPNRAQHLLVVERAVQSAAARLRDKARGQMSLFGDGSGDDAAGDFDVSLPPAPDWTQSQKLSTEKEILGFYLTSHPLAQYADRLEGLTTHTTKDLQELDDGQEVVVGGMVAAIKKTATKKASRNGNSRYVNFDLEDQQGIVRCILWPDDFARDGDKIEPDTLVIIEGRVDRRGREPNLICNRVHLLDEAERKFTRQVAVKFRRGYHTEQDMRQVRDILARYPGGTPVLVYVDTWTEAGESPPSQSAAEPNGDASAALHMPRPRRHLRACVVTPTNVSAKPELKSELVSVLGDDCFRFLAGNRPANSG